MPGLSKDHTGADASSLEVLVDRITRGVNRDPQATLVLCDEALAETRWQGDAAARTQLLLCRVRVLFMIGRKEECRDSMTITLSQARLAHQPLLLGKALAYGASLRLDMGDFVGASELAEQALEVGLEHGNLTVVARTLSMVCHMSSWLGWHEQALNVNDVAQLAAARDERPMPIDIVVLAERCMCFAYRLLDERQDERHNEMAATIASFQEALARAQRHFSAAGQVVSVRQLDHVNRLVRWIDAGHTGDAATLDELATELDTQPPIEPSNFNEFRRLAMALACIHKGCLGQAVSYLNAAVTDIPHEQSPMKVTILRTLADVHAAAGDWKAAHAAQQAFEAAQRARLDERSRRHVNLLIERVQRDGAHARAFVSHDLRSPLTAIISATEFAERCSPDEARQALELVAVLADRALHYTEEYLRYAHLQSLKRSEFELLAVEEVVSAAADEVRRGQKARSTQIVVRDAVDNSAGAARIQSHRGTLHRIIVNLLANAVRAAPEHSVVEVELHADEQRCFAAVRDHGPGLPVDALLLLVTGEPAPVRAGGTGLGLRYVVEAASALGGTLFAANEPGGGARITLALPRT